MRLLMLASMTLALGCSGDPPLDVETFPVRGKVTGRDGKPLPGGAVQLHSGGDPTLIVAGTIGPDGEYELFTTVNNQRVPGVPAATYRVTILPMMDASQSAIPMEWPKPVTIASGENRLDFSLARPGR
jgi:hypothetical protein